jgi:DNA-binding response OmpR family regulator
VQRILVIDDDPSIRSLFKRGLGYEGFTVDLAESGEAGLSSVRDNVPDLIILDVMMPGIDGFEVLRRLRAAGDTVPVIMLTAKDTDESQIEGLDAGADDYVLKPVTFDVLLARIRAVQRRRGVSVSNRLRFQDVTMDVDAFSVKRGDRSVQLTNLEFKLLQEFMEQPERVMNKQKLLDRVWGLDFFGDDNVVEVYVKQLRQKLEAEGEQRLIHTIRNVGYVLRGG